MHTLPKTPPLLGIRSTDPFILTNCVPTLLIANQRWGSHCHAALVSFSFCEQSSKFAHYVIEVNR